MRRRVIKNSGVALTELMITLTVSAVVMLIGWATWEMGWRETRAAQTRVASSRDAYSVLHVITKEVLRAQKIEVPDPDHASLDSIQLQVNTPTGIERRAFRLEGDALMLDLKDAGVAPFEVFDGLVALSFRILGAPEDGRVEIVCTMRHGGRSLQMRTVVHKRN